MTDKKPDTDADDESTQETPGGARIPVPRKGDVLADLRRAARRKPGEDSDAGRVEDER